MALNPSLVVEVEEQRKLTGQMLTLLNRAELRRRKQLVEQAEELKELEKLLLEVGLEEEVEMKEFDLEPEAEELARKLAMEPLLAAAAVLEVVEAVEVRKADCKLAVEIGLEVGRMKCSPQLEEVEIRSAVELEFELKIRQVDFRSAELEAQLEIQLELETVAEKLLKERASRLEELAWPLESSLEAFRPSS